MMQTPAKLMKKGILPIQKQAGVTLLELLEWTKLSLYFEAPKGSLRQGSLSVSMSPRYADSHQTGLMLLGFGIHSQFISAYRQHFTNHWIVQCRLGLQTVDHYARSPILAQHRCEHIHLGTIHTQLDNLKGEIVQTNPPTIYQEWKHNIRKLNNHSRDESLEDWHPNDHEDGNNLTNNVAIDDSWEAYVLHVSKPACERVRVCHSIDLVEYDSVAKSLRLQMVTDSLFSPRAFVRDLGLRLGCHASIETSHLRAIGPLTDASGLAQHELHFDQINQAMALHTVTFTNYLAQLREKYPPTRSRLL